MVLLTIIVVASLVFWEDFRELTAAGIASFLDKIESFRDRRETNG